MSAYRLRSALRLSFAALLGAASMAVAAPALPPDVPPHQLLLRQWQVTDGLPQTTVLDIGQDASGYLWVATQDGIARFDGARFVEHRSLEHAALQDDFRTALSVDRDGVVWSGSVRGLARFDGREWQRVEGVPSGPVHRLLPATDGGVWVAAGRGLFHADRGSARQITPSSLDDAVTALAHSPDGTLVIALHDRLIIDPAGAARTIAVPGFDDLRSVAAAPAGSGVWLWIGGAQGLLGIDADGRVVRRPLKQHDVEALLVDRAGSVWVGSADGLWRMPAGELPRRVQIDRLDAGHWIRSLHQDREGNLWVGTHVDGLFRLRADLFRRIGAVDGLSDRTIWSLYADPQGGLWAGGDDGAWHGGLQGFRKRFDADTLPHPMVLAFLRSTDGTLWIGTRGGLAKLSAGGSTPVPVAGVDSMIYSLFEDDRRRIWIGSRDGVQRIVAGRLETLGAEHGLPDAAVRDIVQMSDGRIWIGGELGAYRENAPDRFGAIGAGQGLDEMRVRMIRETRPGEVMLAIHGGIIRTTLAGEPVRRIDQRAGLHAGMVMLLQPGDDGQLWYSTHEGIGRLPFMQIDQWLAGSRSRLEPQVFGALDAPQPAQCNGGHHDAGVLVDGRWLWCPSLQGAMVLDLQAAGDLADAPQPVIEAVRVGGQSQPLGTDRLVLPLGARDVEFEYAGLHLSDPAAVGYRVQLIGYDRQPRAVGQRRMASYTNLPPGEYRFQVTAELAGGQHPQHATLALQVPAQVYESRWFQALLLSLVACLVIGAAHWHRRRFAHQRSTLAELVRQRTAELEEVNRRLLESSVTDPLTGLHNRRYLLSEVSQDVAQVDRTYTTGRKDSNRDLLFLMIDFDHFKQINDRYGHRAGDQVLTQLATLLDELVRECDYVVRWGGEEFLVVGRQVDRGHSSVLAERILSAVRRHRFVTDHGELRCTCSIGIAVYPPLPGAPRALSWQETIELADAATYFAKQDGRDRWVEIGLPGSGIDDDFMERFRDSPRALAERGQIEVRSERTVDVAA